jgi:AraC family transcriptional regulator
MTSRTRLFESPVGLVERVECHGPRRPQSAEDYSPDFQIAFPYRGVFVWHVGHDAVVSDPNQVLFIRGGEPFRLGDYRPDGFAEVIVTPAQSVLRQVAEIGRLDLERHPFFARRSRRATPDLQRRCASFVQHAADTGVGDRFRADEELVVLLKHALQLEAPLVTASPQTRRLIRHAKEFLAAHFTERIQLSHVAEAVNASPAYLTDVFRRFEGVPLHRYLTQLRLARALVELPHATDITRLALDLGFSSHSHFTFAFKRTFGCRPSEFRRTAAGRMESPELARISA